MIPGGQALSQTATSQATAPLLGARAPQRQRISQPLPAITQPISQPITQPAQPVVVPVLQPQSAAWRERAVALAWENDYQCRASYSGHSARGVEVYAVPSASRGHLTYRVTFTPDVDAQTIHDGRYICSCMAASHGKPCRHAGAALLLAQWRAEVRDSIALAEADHRSWAWATHDGWSDMGRLAWFRMHDYSSASRGIGRVRVGWDTERDVAIWCDCGRRVCEHVGAVALRVAQEKADWLRRAQQGYGPDWSDDLAWDGAVLPAALV